MISRLNGHVLQKKPGHVILDVNGVGYKVNIPLTTFNALPDLHDKAVLFTSLIHKEDRMELYGFKDEETLSLFELLLSVSGIGPKLALILLSNLTPDELRFHVQEQSIDKLKKINGIGPKKAEKILFELKGKVKEMGLGHGEIGHGISQDDDLQMALLSLGYTTQEADKIMQKPEVKSQKGLEDKIREALKYLGRGA